MTIDLDKGTGTSRRKILALTTGVLALPVGLLAFAKSDFWNRKDSSQWSEDEREHMLTNSPWAHRATLSFDRDADGLSGVGAMPAGGPGGGPMGGGRGGTDMGSGGRGGPVLEGQGGDAPEGAAPKLDLIVRWESAATIRAALADAVSAQPDAYVISLTGMPAMGVKAQAACLRIWRAPTPRCRPIAFNRQLNWRQKAICRFIRRTSTIVTASRRASFSISRRPNCP